MLSPKQLHLPSLSTEVTALTCFLPCLLVCLTAETPVSLMLKNHSSKILRTSLIFMYIKNDIVTGLLNHATLNIMVAVGSWSEKILDFPKFSRQSGPHICIIMLKKLCRFFMITPCIKQYWKLFHYQLMHTMLKNTESLKHSKITLLLTCFGLRRNHLQGATVSAWLKLHMWLTVSA